MAFPQTYIAGLVVFFNSKLSKQWQRTTEGLKHDVQSVDPLVKKATWAAKSLIAGTVRFSSLLLKDFSCERFFFSSHKGAIFVASSS